MKWTYKLAFPSIDLSGYRAALDKHMREQVAQAALTWLEAVLPRVPVWSGASRATFYSLANEIGFSVSTTPVAMSRVGVGRSHGEGGVAVDGSKYTFYYSTTLPWLVWNEYHNANTNPDPTKFPPPAKLKNPGPYRLQVEGARAFLRFADRVELPSVKPYVRHKVK